MSDVFKLNLHPHRLNRSSKLGPSKSVTKKIISFSTEIPYLTSYGNPRSSSALKFWISLSS